MNEPICKLAEAVQHKQPAVLAIVVETRGASPAKIGAQIVLFQDGTTAGTVGGGKLESSILNKTTKIIRNNRSRTGHLPVFRSTISRTQ